MKHINLSIASLSILFLVALLFNELQLAVDYTFLHGGMFARFFSGLFGFIGKGLLLGAALYVVYRSWATIKIYHVLFEIPRLALRSFCFIVGLIMATIGFTTIHSLLGIFVCMFGCAIVLFLFGKWAFDMFDAYRSLLRRRIIRR